MLMAPAGPFLHYWPLERLQQGLPAERLPLDGRGRQRGQCAARVLQPWWLKRSG